MSDCKDSIDKTSSAELSEAINTMYQWYKDSGACYVFLPDAPHKMGHHLKVG